MKTSALEYRSLLRGTLMILATLVLIAYLLPSRAEAGVRVVAQVGPVAVDYRDRGPGYDADARVVLAPVAARVLVGRPACGPDRGGCVVQVMSPCGRHDRDRDGRCDKCERRDQRDDRRHACDDRGRDGRYDASGRCGHTDRCQDCGYIEVGGCRAHKGMMWVAGHYERTVGRHGRGNRVWVPAHWERQEVAYR